MTTKICRKCRYWRPNNDGTHGVCKRFPPIVVYMANYGEKSVRPNTSSDDTCGEYKPSKHYDKP